MHPPSPLSRRCRGPLDRRTWLKIGGLNLGALAVGLQPSLAGVLAAAEQPAQVDKDFSVILFWANGGPSHIDLFDLKPAAPVEYRGPFKPIRTTVPGMEITELLPRLAGMADKFTLLRSLHHERNEHSGGTHRFLSGYPSRAANLNHGEYPELGSVVARSLDDRSRLAARQREIPLFAANTAFYGGGPAYLGPAYAPYMPAPNPITASGENEYDPVPIYNTGGRQDDLAISSTGVVSLSRRMQLLQNLDAIPRRLDRSGTMAALDRFQQHAVGMLSSPRTREAFDLTRESEQTRDRYGRSHFGKSLLTCRRLIEAGVRFVQCQAEFRLRPETGVTSNWDDHSVNSHIFKSLEEKLPSFDESVSALIEDLSQRGLDRHVLFLFCGEFGRTPKIMYNSPEKRPGRDHWNKAMTVLLAGGGLRMAQVIGKTSAKAEEPVERVMDSNCLLATIYRRFGIDTARTFADTSGRPIAILPSGIPIEELF